MPGESVRSLMRQRSTDSEDSMVMDDIAAARYIAREMDEEDKRAKQASRGQQEGTLLAPPTALGRGLSRGMPRPGTRSPKPNHHRSATMGDANPNLPKPNHHRSATADGSSFQDSHDGFSLGARSLTPPRSRSPNPQAYHNSVDSMFDSSAGSILSHNNNNSALSTGPPGNMYRGSSTAGGGAATAHTSLNRAVTSGQRRGLAGKKRGGGARGNNTSPMRGSTGPDKPSHLNSRAVSAGNAGPYYGANPEFPSRPSNAHSRAVSGGSAGPYYGANPEFPSRPSNAHSRAVSGGSAGPYYNGTGGGSVFGDEDMSVMTDNMSVMTGQSALSEYSTHSQPHAHPNMTRVTQQQRLSGVAAVEPVQRATTTGLVPSSDFRSSTNSSGAGPEQPFRASTNSNGTRGGTLERGSIVADSVAQHMSMDVSEMTRSTDFSVISNRHPRTSSMDNSTLDGSSGVFTNRSTSKGDDPAKYRDAKGLARPNPNAQMTRLEPTTALGGGGSRTPPPTTRLEPSNSRGSTASGYSQPTHHSRGVSMGSTTNSSFRSIPEGSETNGGSHISVESSNHLRRSANTAANDASGADRNEMRRLKFGLRTSNVNDPGTIVTPVNPPPSAAAPTPPQQEYYDPDSKEAQLKLLGADAKPGSFHLPNGGPSLKQMDDSSKHSLNDRSAHSHSHSTSAHTPAVVASAPPVHGPGAYRVEHQPSHNLVTADVRPSTARHEIASAAFDAVAPAPDAHPSDNFGVDEEAAVVSSKQKKLPKLSRGAKIMVALGCVILIVVIVLVVILTGGGGGGSNDGSVASDAGSDTVSPTMSPTAASRPPDMDIETYLWQLLPETTTQSISQNVNGSQADAIAWILQDPQVTEYSNTRLMQRSALATLYFQLNGAQWQHQGHWLSYDHHECDWLYREKACDAAEEKNGVYIDDAKVREIKLVKSKIRGNLPPEISLLTNLKVLDLSENEMQGSIPSQLGLMTSLTELALDTNVPGITGSIPSEVGRLTSLARLYLNDNSLTGSLPQEMGTLVELKDLFFENNKMTSSLPTTLGNLVNLNRLYLQQNLFTGPLPSEFGKMSKMVHFQLNNNRMNGELPGELGNMGPTSLRILNLAQNSFTGFIPAYFSAFTAITDLDLSNNTFFGSIPAELPPNVKVLNFGRSGVSGTLPSELGRLTRLQQLLLYKNIELNGPIPSQLGLCSHMKYLELDFNKLSGTIPTQIGAMTHLEHLWLYLNNYLTGPIPSEIGQCTKMQYLFLDRNRLTGPVPPQLGNLQSLIQMNISNTGLTGILPVSWCGISAGSFDCGKVCGCGCPC